jgi:hypothetical protein
MWHLHFSANQNNVGLFDLEINNAWECFGGNTGRLSLSYA